MAITIEHLQEIDRLLATSPRGRRDGREFARAKAPASRRPAVTLRTWPMKFPFRSYAHCDLYLLDGRDHCVRVTADPAVATGLIIAAKGASA